MRGEVISGRDVFSGRGLELHFRDEKIVDARLIERPPERRWIAPSLLDLQINGYAGIDYQQPSVTFEQLLESVRQLRRAGCAQFFLTIVTADWPCMLAQLRHLRALRGRSTELQAAIAGWHIEGPFLSSEPGFYGAHDPAALIDPTPQAIRDLRTVAGDERVLLTLAPERCGAIDAVALAVSLGVVVSLGHTNVSAAVLDQAIHAGARSFTHLGNGCTQQLDRHDNILWRVLDRKELFVAIIPDRMHVSPLLFRVFHRQIDPERIWYTTDCVAPAGAPPGRYSVGRFVVDVGPDQIVRQPGRTNFAGSALRPVEGVIRAVAMLGKPWQETWSGFSRVPAALCEVDIALTAGKPATFCVLETSAENQIVSGELYVNGTPVTIDLPA